MFKTDPIWNEFDTRDFSRKYYKYKGGMEMKDNPLTIGSYKSTWLADSVAA